MAVQPTQPDRIGGSNVGRARRSPESPQDRDRVDRGAPRATAKGDSIEISTAAGQIQPVSSDYDLGESDLSPERLQQVLARVSEGFYLRPEVRAEVARKLAKVLADS